MKQTKTKSPWVFIEELSGIQEYRFDNGLKVLLVENHSAPVVTVQVVYKVGSRNEAVGYTGSTHFLEHMLFRGTPSFNKSKGTLIAQVLSKEGANFNATTWLDRTTYFETLPAHKLELALQIEAERMSHAYIRNDDRQAEMTVVRNELERDENEPDSIMWKNLFAHAFLAHPYHHPTIGWHSDVEGVPTARLKQFYKEFYHPDNATLIVVGDFQTDDTLALIQTHFGGISAAKKRIPPMYTQEFPQQGERRFTIKRPGQLGIVQMAFHVPPQEHPDSYALDVLQEILTDGMNSRLYQALVETHLCVYAGAYNLQLRDPGLFIIACKLASEVKHQQVEKEIWKTLKQLQKVQPSAKEMQRVINQTKATFAYHRHGNHHLASILGEFEATADWRYLVNYQANLEKVTPADVQRVAKTYFSPDNLTVGHFIPETPQTVDVNLPASNTPSPENQKKGLRTAPKSSTPRSEVLRSVWDSGVVFLSQENHLDNTVALQGKITAGSVYNPPQLWGLAEMTASMLKKGTKNHDKLALDDALSFMGSSINFRVGLDYTSFSIRCLSEHTEKTLELLRDILRSPTFPEAEFKKLKKQRIDRLRQRLESTDAMAYDVLYRDLYPPHHPHYAPTVEALIQATEAIELKDIKAFYKKHYGLKGLLLSAVGDILPARLEQLLAKHLKGWQSQNPPLPRVENIPLQKTGQRCFYEMADKANISVMMGHQTTLTRDSQDYFPAILANHVLGQSSLSSRLGLKIRDDLGLTYGIYSYFADIGRGAGPWLVSVTTNPQNLERTIGETLKVIENYLQEGIGQQELADAKSSLIGSYLVNLSTNPEIAYRLVQLEQYGLGLDYFQKRAKMIEKVTQKQVNAAIKKYFHPQRLSLGIAGQMGQGS